MNETPKPIPISKLKENTFSDDMWIMVSRQEHGKWKSYRVPLWSIKCDCDKKTTILPDPYEILPKNKRTIFHVMDVVGTENQLSHGITPCDYDRWNATDKDHDDIENGYYPYMHPTRPGCYGTHKIVDCDEISVFAQPLKYNLGRNPSQWVNGTDIRQSDLDGERFFQSRVTNLKDFNELYGGYYPWGNNTTRGAVISGERYWRLYKDSTKAENISSGWDIITTNELLQLLGQLPRYNTDRWSDILDFFFCDKDSDICTQGKSKLTNRKNISGITLVPNGKLQNVVNTTSRPVAVDSFGSTAVMATKRIKHEEQIYLTSFADNGSPMHSKGVRISSAVAFAHGGNVRYSRVKTPEELGYKLIVDSVNDKVLFVPADDSRENLPIGMERGVALRYANREHRLVLKSWSEIQAEANELMTSGIINVDSN